MRRLIVLAASVVLALSGCRAPQDNLIIPGKRVGSLQIGHTRASEVGVNGAVSDKYNDQGLGISFDKNLKIDAVHVTRANYETREGLAVGASEDAVIAAYGKGEIVSIPVMAGSVQKGLLSKNTIHYPGIRWIIGEDGNVTSILVSAK